MNSIGLSSFSLALCLISLSAAACNQERQIGESTNHELCSDYLDCVAVVKPDEIGTAVSLYGADSACWASDADAARCAMFCVAEQATLYGQYGVDACRPPDAQDPSLLGESHRWNLVSEELVSGSCPFGSGLFFEVMTIPTSGGMFELTRPSERGPLSLSLCQADGRSFTCTDGEWQRGFQVSQIEGSVDADLSTLVIEADTTATVGQESPISCGRWRVTTERAW